MIRVGLIDHFLSEWHANNYPRFFRELHEKEGGEEIRCCYAYAECDVSPYDGVTTDEWCKKFGVEKCDTIAEVVEKSDALIVLSPDNPERHPDLCALPLKSGKRVYVDKTFAPDRATAVKIMEAAKRGSTPVWSSSALRFADEIAAYRKENRKIDHLSVEGPLNPEIYSVHLLEILRTVWHETPKAVLCPVNDDATCLAVFAYPGGRHAVYQQVKHGYIPFRVTITEGENVSVLPIGDAFWGNCIREMATYFKTGVLPVQPDETIDVMAMREGLFKAIGTPGVWISL